MGSWDRKQQKHQRAPQLLLSCLHEKPAVVSTGAGLSTTVWQPQIQGRVRGCFQGSEAQQPGQQPGQPGRGRRCCR